MSDDSSSTPISRVPSVTGWGVALLAVGAMFVLYFSAQVIGELLVSIIPLAHHWSTAQTDTWFNTSILAQFLYGLLADGLIVAGVAVLLKLFRWRWSSIGLLKPTIRHLAAGLLATVPYYILYILLVVVIGVIVPSLNVDQKQQIGFNSVHGALPLLATFLSLVIIPPLAEEIAMRGFLYSGLRKALPKVAAALVVSILFGAAHLAEGGSVGPLWIGAIDTFTLSLVLVFLRERTGNLWAGIVLHATKNCIAFVSLFIIGGR